MHPALPIINALTDHIALLDPEGTIIAVNTAWTHFAQANGATPETATGVGLNYLAICNTVVGADAALAAAVATGLTEVLAGSRDSFTCAYTCHAPHEQRWFQLRATPLGSTAGAILVHEAVTGDKRNTEMNIKLVAQTAVMSQANVALVRALKLKDEFLAMMSHELRTPLNVVLGIAEAIEQEIYGPINTRQRQSLGTLMRSGRHLTRILADMLDMAELMANRVALDLQPVNVDILCSVAMQFVWDAAQKKHVQLQHTVMDGVEGLVADEHRMTQILVNLLDNAVKFTPNGGTVGLEVIGKPNRECIQFVVWDTGIGIAEADYDRLFQPFTQVDGSLARAHNGLGLGLAMVRRLVELHGGSVTLESILGQGSRFTVNLPWATEDNVAPVELPIPAVPSRDWSRPPRILIADDHEPTLQLYHTLLSRQGCTVVVARTGVEALTQARAVRPEVVLMDIQLPDLDGLTAIQHLRTDPTFAAVPIIALTALAMPGDRERCLAAGANAYLARPVSLRTLLETIKAHYQ